MELFSKFLHDAIAFFIFISNCIKIIVITYFKKKSIFNIENTKQNVKRTQSRLFYCWWLIFLIMISTAFRNSYSEILISTFCRRSFRINMTFGMPGHSCRTISRAFNVYYTLVLLCVYHIYNVQGLLTKRGRWNTSVKFQSKENKICPP